MTRTARCCCGDCAITVEGEPTLNGLCHCTSCRKRTGSAFGWSAYFPDDKVTAKSGKMRVYAKDGDATHPLIFVGMSGNDSPAIANELKSRSASEEVDSTFLGMGVGDAKDYPAGPLGGVLRCGTGPLGGGTATACAWADSSTVGAVLTPQGGSVASLAGTTLDLRNAAER